MMWFWSTPDAIAAIARQAIERGTGARGLKGVLEGLLQKTMYEVPSRKNIKHCIVHKEAVCGEAEICLMEGNMEHLDASVRPVRLAPGHVR